MLVYVSGNNGSGKTTLGRALAGVLNWTHLPEEKFDQTYLADLFRRQKRWSFEAQTHFLLFKIGLVRRAGVEAVNAIIDRSPYEDAQIFARYFHDRGKLEPRSFKTYLNLYEQLVRDLPRPDAILFCRCPLAELKRRVVGRGRQYEELYPKNHLDVLNAYYVDWLQRMRSVFPGKVFEINTSASDFRNDAGAIERAASDLLFLLMKRQQDQLNMFQLDNTDQHALFPMQPVYHGSIHSVSENSRGFAKRLRKPHVYIAAPFTGKATPNPKDNGPASRLQAQASFEYSREKIVLHGMISDTEYRAYLESIESVVRESECTTILPHRDINKWGERTLSPATAVAECTQNVFLSDAMVALPEQSYGAHYEIGLALGYGIPVLLLMDERVSGTFISSGLCDQPGVHRIAYSTLEELRQRLRFKINEVVLRLRD